MLLNKRLIEESNNNSLADHRRSYEYIVVRSQIIVIGPGTYEIVAILDA